MINCFWGTFRDTIKGRKKLYHVSNPVEKRRLGEAFGCAKAGS